jgi:hypothetical protein
MDLKMGDISKDYRLDLEGVLNQTKGTQDI